MVTIVLILMNVRETLTIVTDTTQFVKIRLVHITADARPVSEEMDTRVYLCLISNVGCIAPFGRFASFQLVDPIADVGMDLQEMDIPVKM